MPLAAGDGVTYHQPMILARHVSVPATGAERFRDFARPSRLWLLERAGEPVVVCPSLEVGDQ